MAWNVKDNTKKISEGSPNWSSLVCFSMAISGHKLAKATIRKNFKRLVDPEDYDKRDRRAIFEHLYWLSENGRPYNFKNPETQRLTYGQQWTILNRVAQRLIKEMREADQRGSMASLSSCDCGLTEGGFGAKTNDQTGIKTADISTHGKEITHVLGCPFLQIIGQEKLNEILEATRYYKGQGYRFNITCPKCQKIVTTNSQEVFKNRKPNDWIILCLVCGSIIDCGLTL